MHGKVFIAGAAMAIIATLVIMYFPYDAAFAAAGTQPADVVGGASPWCIGGASLMVLALFLPKHDPDTRRRWQELQEARHQQELRQYEEGGR